MLMALGASAENMIVCNSKGILYEGMGSLKGDNQVELAKITNKQNQTGSLKDAMVGADVFIGVSAPNIVSGEMIHSMNEKSDRLSDVQPHTGSDA